MNKIIIIIVIALVVIGGAYLIISNNNSSTVPAPTSQIDLINPAPTPVVPIMNNPKTLTPANVTVDIKNFSFNPSTLNIKTGTKVTWVNDDSVAHTVTSDSGNLLNSGTISPGQSFSFTFSSTGSTNYHCTVHPMMKASVIVQS